MQENLYVLKSCSVFSFRSVSQFYTCSLQTVDLCWRFCVLSLGICLGTVLQRGIVATKPLAQSQSVRQKYRIHLYSAIEYALI